MLVLEREVGQSVKISLTPEVVDQIANGKSGLTIDVKVLNQRGNSIKLGFDAPRDVFVDRSEIYEAFRVPALEA